MPFGFFKEKETGPVDITCPLCGSRQQESRLAVSSYCKECGAYLSFEKDGEVKARPLTPPDPFADRPTQPEVDVDYSPCKELEEIRPIIPVRKAPEPIEEPTEAGQNLDSPPPQKALSADGRYQGTPAPGGTPSQNKIETRNVTCFECGATHAANILANSTQCRNCGRMISMADRDIHETWTSPIQTRGNVHIHKKALVRAASIQCHDLIVEGTFTDNAECSGDLIIRRNGKIPGQVKCRRLLVEKRAKVEFLGPVEMDEGKIDGIVTGNLTCHGLLALEKKSVLTGNLKVGSLTIADGAKHNGQVRMGPF
ncbi:MAG: bactofilin family protein [Akkermansiaceae bacterium]